VYAVSYDAALAGAFRRACRAFIDIQEGSTFLENKKRP
jgi:hypothetical protein